MLLNNYEGSLELNWINKDKFLLEKPMELMKSLSVRRKILRSRIQINGRGEKNETSK